MTSLSDQVDQICKDAVKDNKDWQSIKQQIMQNFYKLFEESPKLLNFIESTSIVNASFYLATWNTDDIEKDIYNEIQGLKEINFENIYSMVEYITIQYGGKYYDDENARKVVSRIITNIEKAIKYKKEI